jgi:hypothetical protein
MDTINEFPDYIGFGRLNPKTISESTDLVSADYFFQDKPVYRITHNTVNGSWQIKDIFEDKGNLSSSKDLKSVVMQHFNYLDCKTNPIFHFIQDKICNLGNVYFENLASMKDKAGVVSYFPAGRMVILRLPTPIAQTSLAVADALENNIPYLKKEKRPLFTIYDHYHTSVLLSKENGETAVNPIIMIEFIVTLASLYDVVDWICANNLISTGKMFRLIIKDVNTIIEHSLQKFEGDSKEDNTTYTFIYKGLNDSKFKFEEFEKRIVNILAGEMSGNKT